MALLDRAGKLVFGERIVCEYVLVFGAAVLFTRIQLVQLHFDTILLYLLQKMFEFFAKYIFWGYFVMTETDDGFCYQIGAQ